MGTLIFRGERWTLVFWMAVGRKRESLHKAWRLLRSWQFSIFWIWRVGFLSKSLQFYEFLLGWLLCRGRISRWALLVWCSRFQRNWIVWSDCGLPWWLYRTQFRCLIWALWKSSRAHGEPSIRLGIGLSDGRYRMHRLDTRGVRWLR